MNYALNTPVQRNLYIPQENESMKLQLPPHTPETDQTHRNLQWLFHKPQNHVIFPMSSESARVDKKK